MPHKLRKRRVIYKTRNDNDEEKLAAPVIAHPSKPPLASQPNPARIAKQQRTHEYVRADLKRTAIIGGAIFVLLIVLRLILG